MRLNDYYRRKLRKDVCDLIDKEYENSPFGKEFKELTEEVRLLINTARGHIVPGSDLIVLKNYNATETIDHFRLSKKEASDPDYEMDCDEDDVVTEDYIIEYPFTVETGDFVFSPGIHIPLKMKQKILKSFVEDTPQETLSNIFDISDRYRCEVMSIKRSYSHVLETSTTMKSLVKKAPIFQQFVHKYIKDEVDIKLIEDVPVDDSLKTIQAFEQSLIKE
jgi:hypothetical protein